VDISTGRATGIGSKLPGAGATVVNEVQNIVGLNKATAGTFTLTLNGETTDDIVFNATPAAIKSALEKLVGVASVRVTGTSAQFVVTFLRPGGTNLPDMTLNSSQLTKPTAATVVVQRGTNGVSRLPANAISKIDKVVGGDVDGNLIGTEQISGGSKNDLIISKSGTGSTALLGGVGNDRIVGSAGADKNIDGGVGDDLIFGAGGRDLIFGGPGNDKLQGGEGKDDLHGGAGEDVLIGGEGDDKLLGGDGNDTYIFGPGWGNDTLVNTPDPGNDTLDFGSVDEPLTFVLSGKQKNVGNATVVNGGRLLVGTGVYTPAIPQDSLRGTKRSTGIVTGTFSSADKSTVTLPEKAFDTMDAITLSKADNTFLFGDDWGTDSNFGVLQLPTFLNKNKDRQLTVKTSPALDNGHSLVLDFRAVTWQLTFVFEKEDDGSTSLVVGKAFGGSIFNLNNEIKFEKVNEKTVIYGGRNVNTYVIAGDATFGGTLIGGTGMRPLSRIATDGALDNLITAVSGDYLGLSLPQITVVNQLDFTQSSPFSPTYVSLLSSSLSSVTVQQSRDAITGQEIQRLLIPEATSGNFRLKHGNKTSGSIAFDTNSETTRARIEAALNATTMLGANAVSVKTVDANTFDVQFTATGNAVEMSLVNVDLAKTAVGTTTITPTGTAVSEVQTINLLTAQSGTFQLKYQVVNGERLVDPVHFDFGSNDTIAKIATRLQAALNKRFGSGATTVTGAAKVLTVTFNTAGNAARLAFVTTPLATAPVMSSNNGSPVTGTTAVTTEGASGRETQTLQLPASVTGGSFQLKLGDSATGPIQIGADDTETATNIQSALNTFLQQTSILGASGSATVTKLASPAHKFRVTFTLDRTGDFNVPVMNADSTKLLQLLESKTKVSVGPEAVPVQFDGVSAAGLVQQSFSLPATGGNFTISIESTGAGNAILNKALNTVGLSKKTTTLPIAGNATAAQIQAEVRMLDAGTGAIVRQDSTTKVWTIELASTSSGQTPRIRIDGTKLTKSVTPSAVGAVVALVKGGAAVKPGQVLTSKLAANAPFSLKHNGKSSASIVISSSAATMATRIAAALNHVNMLGPAAVTVTPVTVTVNNTAVPTWEIAFNDPAKAAALSAFVPSDFTQKAFQGVRARSGFTGTVKYMTDVAYGAGVNVMFGSNIGLSKSQWASISAARNNVSTGLEGVTPSVWDSVFDGDILGANTFEVGGNLLVPLAEYAADKAGIKTDDSRFLKVAGGLASELLDQFTLAPGVHIMSGLTGGDTYVFQGYWGAAAVLEIPDISITGTSAPEFYDTLDLGGYRGDLDFTIYQVSSSNIEILKNLFSGATTGQTADPPPLEIGTNVVLVQAYPEYVKGGNQTVPIQFIVANDIENISGGHGVNRFKFVDGATIQGTIGSSYGGRIEFDYSDYQPLTTGVNVDATAGPSLELIPSYTEGAFNFPGISYSYGSADGVKGNRLGGLEDWLEKAGVPHVGQFFKNFAVAGVDKVIGSPKEDILKGLDVFVIGNGGLDTIEGSDDGKSTVSFDNGSFTTTVDLSSGKYWFTTPQTQQLQITAGGGTFKLTLDGQTTAPLAYNTSTNNLGIQTAGVIQKSLQSLLKSGTVQVSYVASGKRFNVVFSESVISRVSALTIDGALLTPNGATPASAAVAMIRNTWLQAAAGTIVNAAATPVNEVQRIRIQGATGGNFRLSVGDGTTANIAYNADRNITAANIATALNALLGNGNVTVVSPQAGKWDVTFAGSQGARNIALMTVQSTGLTAVTTANVATITEGTAINGLQRLSTNADGGWLIFGYGAKKTVPLTHDASAADVEAALRNIGVETEVTGKGLTAEPWEVRLLLSDSSISLLTIDATELVKFGAAPSATGTLTDIHTIVGGHGNDLMIGSPEDDTYILTDNWGNDVIFEKIDGGHDKLDFSNLTVKPDIVKISDHIIRVTQTIDGKQSTLLVYNVEDADSSGWVESSSYGFQYYATGPGVGANLQGEGGGTNSGPVAPVSVNQVQTILDAAVARWEKMGVSAGLLGSVQISLTDLPGQAFARTGLNSILIDPTAAGVGWFVDATPAADSEFSIRGGGRGLLAPTDSDVAGRIDLLTVVMHELGHVLGLDHQPGLMNDSLGTGVRHLPTRALVELASSTQTFGLASAEGIQESLIAGLDAFATWSGNFGTNLQSLLNSATKIPFTNSSLSSLFPSINTSAVRSKVMSQIRTPLETYFLDAGSFANFDGILGLENIGPSSSISQTMFEGTVDLGSFVKSISLNLSDLAIDSEFVSVISQLGITVQQSTPIDLSGGLDLKFEFGLDQNGQFVVRNPKVVAHISLGDHEINILDLVAGTDGTPGTAGFVLAGDQRNAFAINDRLIVQGGTDNDGNYTVAAAPSYNADRGQTTIFIKEDLAFFDYGGTVRRTFDLNLKLGPIGVGVDDGFASFAASVSLGANGTYSLADLIGNTISISSPRLDGTSNYDLLLPIKPTGALSGLASSLATISASSSLLPDDATLAQLIAAIPKTLEIRGPSDVFNFKGMSFEMLLNAINGLLDGVAGDRAAGTGIYSELPIIDKTAAELLVSGNAEAEVTTLVPGNANVAEVQKLFHNGSSGRFRLTYEGKTSGFLNYNAAASAVKNALLPLGANVNVTGAGTGESPYVITFVQKGARPEIAVNATSMKTDFVSTLRYGFRKATEAVTDLSRLEARMNSEIKRLLKMSASSPNPVSLKYQDSQFFFGLGFEYKPSPIRLPMDLDLAQFDSTGALDALGLTIKGDGGDLVIGGSASVALNLGIDLRDVTTPKIFFQDSSAITAQHSIDNSAPLNFEASIDVPVIGDVGMYIKNGDLGVNLTLGLGFADDSAGDNRYTLSELAGAFGPFVRGTAFVDLPLYFPSEAFPLGGTTKDLDGDGIADNALHLKGTIVGGKNVPGGISTSFTYATPALSSGFDLFALLNDPRSVLLGLESMFDGLKSRVEENIANVNLPLVGDQLADAADFITDLKQDLLGKPNSAGKYIRANGQYLNSLGGFLQDAIDHNRGTFNEIVAKVQQALFDKLGSVLKVPVVVDGKPQYDSRGNVKYRSVQTADDVQVLVTKTGISFNVLLAGSVFDGPLTVPLDFAAAFPGFALSSNTNINVNLDYALGLGFGFDSQGGFYVDTSGVTKTGDELVLDLGVTIPKANIDAQLFFLKAGLKDAVDADGASGLFGSFTVNLIDANNDGKWQIFNPKGTPGNKGVEGLTAEARFKAEANVDLEARIKIEAGDISLPELTTIIHYDQVFADIRLSSVKGVSTDFGGSAVVTFQDVTLDLGKAISGFVKPVFGQIGDIISPIKPVIDLLTTPIDLGITKLRLLDLARLKLSAAQFTKVEKAVDAIKSTVDFIDLVNSFNGQSILINFGSFTLGGAQLKGGSKAPLPVFAGPAPDLNKAAKADTSGKASKITKQFGVTDGAFRFPILQDPKSIIGLLTGKDINLFIYDLPKLELGFEYTASYAVFPGLNARLTGKISAATNFSFGFDTSGIRDWAENHDFDPSEIDRIFNGFYVDDHGIQGTGKDAPEITLFAGISAGASLGIGGLLEAGVEGGIEAKIEFNLADVQNPGTGPGTSRPTPVYDGKLRVNEIIARVEQDPLCLFDVRGELRAFLEAFLWVGIDLGFLGEITLFEARERFVDVILASFEHNCPPIAPPLISGIDSSGKLSLFLKNSDGSTIQDAHTHRVERVRRDVSDPAEPKWVVDPVNGTHIQVRVGSFTDIYPFATVKSIAAAGSSEIDQYTIGEGLNNIDLALSTGPGNDKVTVKSGRNVGVNTGDDDDRIDISALVTGRITVNAGAGRDDIRISTPENEALVTYLSSTLNGGDGIDSILGSIRSDIISGGLGGDTLLGLGGDDTIYGEVKNGVGDDETDKIDGGEGNDQIWGNAGNDIIVGGDGNDTIRGGRGDDRISGDDGIDRIFGDGGDDNISGGLGNDFIFAGLGTDLIQWSNGDGDDTVDGQGGADKFFVQADAGNIRDTFQVSRSSTAGVDSELRFTDRFAATTLVKMSGVETLRLEAGEGADRIFVDDLTGATLDRIEVDADRGEIYDQQRMLQSVTVSETSTVIKTNGQNTVFNQYDQVKVFSQNRSLDPLLDGQVVTLRFARQPLLTGAYLFNDDGSPKLSGTDTASGLRLQAFNGTLDSAKPVELVELRSQRLSPNGFEFQRLTLQPGGAYLFNDDGSPKLTVETIGGNDEFVQAYVGTRTNTLRNVITRVAFQTVAGNKAFNTNTQFVRATLIEGGYYLYNDNGTPKFRAGTVTLNGNAYRLQDYIGDLPDVPQYTKFEQTQLEGVLHPIFESNTKPIFEEPFIFLRYVLSPGGTYLFRNRTTINCRK